jgi:PAS domain S-box-containing protein
VLGAAPVTTIGGGSHAGGVPAASKRVGPAVSDRRLALVVDDDPDIALVCSLHLEGAGFEVVEAGNGQQALELAAVKHPDVVVLDYMLPDLDGVEVLRRLKAEEDTAPIPVLMLTARTHKKDQAAAWEAGASDFMVKPFDGKEFVKAVTRLADREAEEAPRPEEVAPEPGAVHRTADALLAAIVRNASDAVICKDLTGTITFWNRGAEQLYGWTTEEAVGSSIQMIAAPETVTEIDDILERVARDESVTIHETSRVARDGRRLSVSLGVTPMHDPQGRVVGAAVIARDVTDRVRREIRYEALIEAAPDAMVIVSEAGVIELVNGQVMELFGYERDELVGEPIEVLMPLRYRGRHPEHRRRFVRSPRLRPMGANLQLSALRKDGTEFPVEISLSPIEADGVVSVCATIRDITERRRVEQSQRQAAEREREASARLREVDRLRTDFLATVSHELRTPLTAIKGFSEWLVGSWDLTEEARKRDMVQRIHHAGGRLDFLIQDLLDFSRLERGKLKIDPEPHALAGLLEEALGNTSTALEAHQVAQRVEPDLQVRVDRNAMLRVLENLLTNAAKFSPRGSTIHLESVPGADTVVLSVRDEGVGIPEDEHEKVFDRFYRSPATATSAPGTGIGLAIVKHFVEAQGGSVELRSVDGQGSDFRVTMPRVR